MLRTPVGAAADAAMPLLRLLPPERAHGLAIGMLKAGFAPPADADDPILATRLWGLDFPNPIGLAAGFDKNAEATRAMLRWGFGSVEIGTVTPRPQPGNPRPRLFRLGADRAIVNRMGFNNRGLAQVAANLARSGGNRLRLPPHGANAAQRVGIVGGNIGKNRDSLDATGDYCRGVAALASLVDYLVINVSSPNTPGLRELQRKSALAALLEATLAARDAIRLDRPPPLLLKIAPDLTPEEATEVANEAMRANIDGLIVANTTTARPDHLTSPHATEPGGLSGAPLFGASTELLAALYRYTDGKIALVGVGGVSSGIEAYAKIRAGASLVQLYTALIYQGPGMVDRVKRELASLLRRDGFASVAAAVGVDVPLGETRRLPIPASRPRQLPPQPPQDDHPANP